MAISGGQNEGRGPGRDMEASRVICANCGKIYLVPCWSKAVKCRQCGAPLALPAREAALAPTRRKDARPPLTARVSSGS